MSDTSVSCVTLTYTNVSGLSTCYTGYIRCPPWGVHHSTYNVHTYMRVRLYLFTLNAYRYIVSNPSPLSYICAYIYEYL